MKITDIEWQQTCHGPLAELQTRSGWLRVEDLGEGYAVTRFDAAKRLVEERAEVTEAELLTLLR